MPWYGFCILVFLFSVVSPFLFFVYREQKKVNDEYRSAIRNISKALEIIAKSCDC